MRTRKLIARRHIPFYLIAAVVFIIDQLTKLLVIYSMEIYRSMTIIPGALFLTHVRNKGAAFGIFPGQILPLIAIGAVISLIIVYFHSQVPRSDRFIQVSLALILGGSLGNLFDRIFRGAVVDFIDFRFWPAFNIADAAVNIGIALTLWAIIFNKETV